MLGHKLLGPGATYGILKLFIPGPRTQVSNTMSMGVRKLFIPGAP